MELKKLEEQFTVCKVAAVENINMSSGLYFIGRTDEEISLVCRTEDTPINTLERDDGWRGFRIQGVLVYTVPPEPSARTFRATLPLCESHLAGE